MRLNSGDGDVAVLNERLQDVAARMLGMEPGAVRSSATDSLKVGVASVLLLELDSLTGAALSGQPIDLARLSQATTLLAKMMPAAALEPKVSPPEGDARARLAELLDGMVRAREFTERQEVEELRAEAERLKAENERLRAAAVSAVSSAAAAPAAPPVPPLRPPIPAPKGNPEGWRSEPWRSSVGGGVSIRAKSWSPPPGW